MPISDMRPLRSRLDAKLFIMHLTMQTHAGIHLLYRNSRVDRSECHAGPRIWAQPMCTFAASCRVQLRIHTEVYRHRLETCRFVAFRSSALARAPGRCWGTQRLPNKVLRGFAGLGFDCLAPLTVGMSYYFHKKAKLPAVEYFLRSHCIPNLLLL
jgi:hypothetical protein